jgi:hypothetical protein
MNYEAGSGVEPVIALAVFCIPPRKLLLKSAVNLANKKPGSA